MPKHTIITHTYFNTQGAQHAGRTPKDTQTTSLTGLLSSLNYSENCVRDVNHGRCEQIGGKTIWDDTLRIICEPNKTTTR